MVITYRGLELEIPYEVEQIEEVKAILVGELLWENI